MTWGSYFPEGCPPEDASPAEGVVFRLTKGDQPRHGDFVPYRKNKPGDDFDGKACLASGLSVYRDYQDIVRLQNRVGGARKKKVAVTIQDLDHSHGVMKPTPSIESSHITWWVPETVSPAPLFRQFNHEETA